MVEYGHLSPVRVAVHRGLDGRRWDAIVQSLADIATDPMARNAVTAAAFLAHHAPAPNELLDSDVYYGNRTVLAGPAQVDVMVARLAEALGVKAEQIPDVVEMLLEGRREALALTAEEDEE